MSRLSAPLVLASGSPRRREILARLGIDFEVAVSDVDETWREGEPPGRYAARVAADKAEAVLGRLGGMDPAPFVLAADTVVVLAGQLLGKPADDVEAAAMLRRLSGRVHDVTTAVAVGRAGTGLLKATSVTTRVVFRSLAAAEVDGYVRTGEGRDKAGAYAVQGLGSGLVSAVQGSYDNVVGLPSVETLGLLREVGALVEWP